MNFYKSNVKDESLPQQIGILVFFGLIFNYIIALSQGTFFCCSIQNELIAQQTDFMNYARNAFKVNTFNFHPLYEYLVNRNNTLIPILTSFLLQHTSELTTKFIIISIYGFIQTLGIPYFVLVLTKNKWAALLALLFIYLAAPNVERIYSYQAGSFITGHQATALFFLLTSLFIQGKYKLFLVGWILSVAIHPTTAIVWSPFFIFLIYKDILKTGFNKLVLSENVINFLLILSPILLFTVFYFINHYLIIIDEANRDSYWDLTKSAFYHVRLFGTYRASLIFDYLSLILALLLIGHSNYSIKELVEINKSIAFLGIGILIGYLLFIELELSTLVGMTLPLRFAVIMYITVVINLIVIVFTKVSNFEKLVALFLLCTFFLGNIHPIVSVFFHPLSSLWVGVLLISKLSNIHKIKLALIFSLGFCFLALILPASTVNANPQGILRYEILSNIISYLSLTFELNHRNFILFFFVSFHILFPFSCILFIKYFLKKFNIVNTIIFFIVMVICLGSMKAILWRIDLPMISSELTHMLENKTEINDEQALVSWLEENIDANDKILTEPKIQLRRVLPRHSSIDLDLISLVAYMPENSLDVINELKDDYGIRIDEAAKIGAFINSSSFNDSVWSYAKNKALQASSKYTYIVETTNRPIEKSLPIYENLKYRVFKKN
jgi:hypothetical protein